MKKFIVRAAAVALLATTLQVLPSASASVAGPVSLAEGRSLVTAATAASDKKKPTKKRFNLKQGASLNDPLTSPMAIRLKVLRALNHTRKGQVIRVMSWSFFDTLITDALISAYRRGVVVQFFMARSLSQDETAGSNFRRLSGALSERKYASDSRRSWARTCSNSCRGRGGAMHSKWVTISKTGISEHVVMQGSANLNIRAAVDQWNDWFTVVGDKKVYDTFQKVFIQAKRDRKAKPIRVRSGKYTFMFSPRGQDPVLDLLNDVRCQGAQGNTGNNGKTVIRIASAVIYGNRGEAIARRLKLLHSRGCDIKLVYTLAPPPVRDILSGIPYRLLAFDRNGDGLFDDYLHMKAMAISGRVGADRTASILYNGSANWSRFGMISDEQGMIAQGRPRLARKYIRWTNRLYDQAASAPSARTLSRSAGDSGIDPYANVELEMR